jgi:hypothetical protein
MAWMPIETLPEPPVDGRTLPPAVMLWLPMDAPCKGRIEMRVPVRGGRWYNRYCNGYELDDFRPTHWQPLPEPPTGD